MLWNNWHQPSSCLDLTIVIPYWLDYRNQRLLLFSLFRTLLHVWCWICIFVTASQDTLRQWQWLPIESRIQFKLCKVFDDASHPHWLLSVFISDTVQLVDDHASHTDLRSASTSRFILPRLRTIFVERLLLLCPKAWNSLPDRLHSNESLVSLKKQLKTYLFNHSA